MDVLAEISINKKNKTSVAPIIVIPTDVSFVIGICNNSRIGSLKLLESPKRDCSILDTTHPPVII